MRAWIGPTMMAATLAGGAIAGCMIFTGSTDGFVEADGGDAATVVDGACLADGGYCLELECTSTAECKQSSDGGSATAEVCCLGLLSATTIGTACQAGSCSLGTIQACASTSECGGGESCVLQSCNFPSNHLEFSACGLLPGCALVVSGAADASVPDATMTDAGAPDVVDSGVHDTGIADANGDASPG